VAAPVAPWDGPKEDVGLKQLCSVGVETIATLHGQPLVGVAGASVCGGIFGDGQRQSDPTLPDLQLRLMGGDATYLSDIAFDQTSHTFGYAFDIPSGALSEGGLTIAVLDADDGTDGQEIGAIRVSKSDLESALAGHRLQTTQSAGIDLFEYEVEPYDGSLKKQVIKLDPAKGGAVVTSFTVSAGDVVRIESQGKWTLGGIFSSGPSMGPAGEAGGGTKDHNLKLFPDLANGAAVAIVGRGSRVKAVDVNPCTKFVAPYAGTVTVGINDDHPSDNRGEAQFTIYRRGPSAAQWTMPGQPIDCD
jgi:hypothetical protein